MTPWGLALTRHRCCLGYFGDYLTLASLFIFAVLLMSILILVALLHSLQCSDQTRYTRYLLYHKPTMLTELQEQLMALVFIPPTYRPMATLCTRRYKALTIYSHKTNKIPHISGSTYPQSSTYSPYSSTNSPSSSSTSASSA